MSLVTPCYLFLLLSFPAVLIGEESTATNPKSDTLSVAQPIMLAAESFVPWQYTVGDFRISWQGESIRSAHTVHTESRGSSVAVLK